MVEGDEITLILHKLDLEKDELVAFEGDTLTIGKGSKFKETVLPDGFYAFMFTMTEDMIKYIIKYVLENAPEEMTFFNNFIDEGVIERLENLIDSEFERVTYTKAVELLKAAEKEFQFPVEWSIDLQTEHERYLTEEVFKKPVFVTDYPKDIKAFYMRLNQDGNQDDGDQPEHGAAVTELHYSQYSWQTDKMYQL